MQEEEPTPTEISLIVPEEPVEVLQSLQDVGTYLYADEHRTNTGDNFTENLFERPFTAGEMIYHPDTDIVRIDLSIDAGMDADFLYFKIMLQDFHPESNDLPGSFAIDFDTDKDGRGDYLVWATSVSTDQWSYDNVTVYEDSNNDVGGTKPMFADPPKNDNGYDAIIFSKDALSTATKSAWVRLASDGTAAVEFAVSLELIGNPQEFLWPGLVTDSVKQPELLEFNDAFTQLQAGSPLLKDTDYPLKELHSMDNTCRKPFGFTTSEQIPGICYSAPPPTPAPTSLREPQ